MSNKELTAAVLDQVNHGRAAFDGGPLGCLPHGDPRSCLSCPIQLGLSCGFLRVTVNDGFILARGHDTRVRLAKALGTWVHRPGVQTCFFRNREVVEMTPEMTEFVWRFDRGHVPELVDTTVRQPILAA